MHGKPRDTVYRDTVNREMTVYYLSDIIIEILFQAQWIREANGMYCIAGNTGLHGIWQKAR